MPTTATLREWLAGDWSIVRDVNGGQGSFAGRASFTPRADGLLRWHEAGEFTLGGVTLPASRTLFIAADGQVSFDGGGPFHNLEMVGDACDAFHPCGPDEYYGHYKVVDDDTMVVTWRVHGPGRDDTIVSQYTRDAAEPGTGRPCS